MRHTYLAQHLDMMPVAIEIMLAYRCLARSSHRNVSFYLEIHVGTSHLCFTRDENATIPDA